MGRHDRAMMMGAALLIGAALPAGAQGVDAFYAGKTIELIVGYPPGGSNDVYGRAVARHIGRHIPGSPQVVFRNMPGAGSILAANHIYNVAPKDGTVLGLLAATNVLDERLGAPGVKFETAKFSWIGRVSSSINVTAMWNTSKIKTINDAYGHAAGDEVLKEIGRRLRVAARGGDVVGRWGGEEFLIILSDQACDIAAGCVAAERFRRAIAGEDIIVLSDVALRVTVSIGVACHNSAVAPVDGALLAADRALYRAKARGRNCVEADRSA
jgi:diguanylate cyclase (GGDEF)-like protein